MSASAVIASVQAATQILLSLTALDLNTYKMPESAVVKNNATFSNIVVGAGTGGSIVANRLSENANTSVLLIEAGDNPHWECEKAGLFPYLVETEMDWNFTGYDDSKFNQNHRTKNLYLPSGKCLGGSSEVHHFYRLIGDPYDYELFANASGSDAWNFDNMWEYVKKSERLEDEYLLNSEYAQYHGLNGLLGVTRETRNDTLKYLEAFGEMGHSIKDDLNTKDSMGFARPLFTISKEGVRQGGSECYIRTAKDRPNFTVMKNTRVTKVLFDDDMNAVGVECMLSDGSYINVYAENEITLSAGTFMTPTILLASGVGPEEDLAKHNITCLKNLPGVGKNMTDHNVTPVCIKLAANNDTVPASNPDEFPVATFVGTGTANKNQNHSDYVTLNLLAKNNPTVLLLICSIVFSFSNDLCDKLAEAGTGYDTIFTVFNLARPESRGYVELQSANPEVAPLIYMGHLTNDNDIENTIDNILDYLRVLNSTYYKSVNAEFIDFGLNSTQSYEKLSREYLRNHITDMSGTTFHYAGTCALGSVVDSDLQVYGTKRLRIADASVMPNQVTANINTVVMAIAEKCADIIKAANSS